MTSARHVHNARVPTLREAAEYVDSFGQLDRRAELISDGSHGPSGYHSTRSLSYEIIATDQAVVEDPAQPGDKTADVNDELLSSEL